MAVLVRDPAKEDPLSRVQSLGDRAIRWGAAIGIGIALTTHSVASAKALTALYDMQRVVRSDREALHGFFWAMYDIEVKKEDVKEVVKKEEPEPEPEPDPEPVAPAPKNDKAPSKEDPYDPPPVAAKAAAVLTRQADPEDKVEDMTNTIVSGDGKATYGMQSAGGQGDNAVTNPHASAGGVPGGRGTGPAKAQPAAPKGPDLSKMPTLAGGSSWSCPFPPEADADQIDSAVATITVSVRADGSPASVTVVHDPGHGFGRAAKMCAMSRRFAPALDRAGTAVAAATPPINVRFTR